MSALPEDASGGKANRTATTEAGSGSAKDAAAALQSGAGSAQWGDGPPNYTLRVALGNIQPNLVAAIWHEKWGRGVASVEIRLKTQGWSTENLAQNASGNFAIDWRGGAMEAAMPSQASSIAIADSQGAANVMPGVTRFRRLLAGGHFQDEKLTLESGQLALAGATGRNQSVPVGIQSISGTVTFSRLLDLRMQPSGISITGPLDMPVMKARASKAPGNTGVANSENP